MLRWPKKVGPGGEQLEVSETHWPPVKGRGLQGLADLVNSMLRTTQPELRPSAENVKAFFDQHESSGSTDYGGGIYGARTQSSAPVDELVVEIPTTGEANDGHYTELLK